MDNGATWAAFGMAVLALIGTIASSINARKVARDKMEFEAVMARDKMAFDAKAHELEARVSGLDEDLAACREQHKASEMDRSSMRGELDSLHKQLSLLRGTT